MQILHVQTNNAAATTSGVSNIQLAAGNTTSSNLLVVLVVWQGTATFQSLVSSPSATWVQIGTELSATGSYKQRMYYAENITGNAAATVTFTVSATGAFPMIIGSEFSGLPLGSFDTTAGTTGSSTTPSTGVTSNRTQPTELLVCGVNEDGTVSQVITHTAGTNFIKPTNGSVDNGTIEVTGGLEYQIVKTQGTDDGTWTLGANVGWAARIATFKNARLSFNPNNLRPRAFAPGLAR